jgi:Ca-activated chloride channel homolog
MTRRTLLSLPVLPLAGQDPLTFRSEVRLVEVYLTVMDHRKRYVLGLGRENFRITDAEQPREIAAFEPDSGSASIALLLDSTGSMRRSLPALKAAVVRFVREAREGDKIALFGFAERLELLQDFTADRQRLLEAVEGIRPAGRTALFDAVAQGARRTSSQPGKKVAVVFTDGDDNASVLPASAAAGTARRSGVPIHTVAQGEALSSPRLMQTLVDVADRSGALAFRVTREEQIEDVFARIHADLRAAYRLAFRAEAGNGEWRPIRVAVIGPKGLTVRCRSGYYAD